MSSNPLLDVFSPINQSLLGQVPVLSKQEIDERMQKAKTAFSTWNLTSLEERVQLLNETADLLIHNKLELAKFLVKEVGKSQKSAESEVEKSVDLIRKIVHSLNYSKEKERECRPNKYSEGRISLVEEEALGLILVISPFSFPLLVAIPRIISALITGNVVVWKPATNGTLAAEYVVKLFWKAGVPSQVLQVMTGNGGQIGNYLTTHPLVDCIHFAGSNDIGNAIFRELAQISSKIPVYMELSGKDTAIVLKDADLDNAAKCIVGSAFSYSGQRNRAISRVLVSNEVQEALMERIVEYMKTLVVGNPLEVNADVVPLISTESADFVWNLLQDAIQKGAVLVTGGKREGNLIYPTLLKNVTSDMQIAWIEPFGPVLPVISVKTEEEAVALSNKTDYDLQTCVLTNDIDKAFLIAKQLEVGTVQINGKTERWPDYVPFQKHSKFGTNRIQNMIDSMTRSKSTIVHLTIR